MGNATCCAGVKASGKDRRENGVLESKSSKAQGIPLGPSKSAVLGGLITPNTPDFAQMAERQDTEFEMLHRMMVLFRSSDLSQLKQGVVYSTRIDVYRLAEGGNADEIVDSTEVIDDSPCPTWLTPIVIDYSMQNDDLYEARLIDDSKNTVIGSVKFKIAELVISKSEFLIKQIELSDQQGDMSFELSRSMSGMMPSLGIMGIEERDGEDEAIEFSL